MAREHCNFGADFLGKGDPMLDSLSSKFRAVGQKAFGINYGDGEKECFLGFRMFCLSPFEIAGDEVIHQPLCGGWVLFLFKLSQPSAHAAAFLQLARTFAGHDFQRYVVASNQFRQHVA